MAEIAEKNACQHRDYLAIVAVKRLPMLTLNSASDHNARGKRRRTLVSMRSYHLTAAIIGAAMTIHRKLGPGLLESAYEACLAYELQKAGMRVERQKAVPLIYEEVRLDCGFRADLVVEGRVVVELKCKEGLHPVDEAQLLSHLRLLHIPIGLLINFHVVLLRDGIRRVVNNYQEDDFSAAQRLITAEFAK